MTTNLTLRVLVKKNLKENIKILEVNWEIFAKEARRAAVTL
jgi:hypothetical protein